MQSETAKVVPLKSESKAFNRSQLARLAAPVHLVLEKGKHSMSVLLRRMFDNADDALFALADQATNNNEQNLYFDSMREVRIRRRSIESAFSQAIDSAFANLAKPSSSEYLGDYSSDDISMESLSLVQNDELEEMVAMDAMINKATERYAESVQHLTLRLDSLVPLKVYQKNNPLGPDILCGAFVEQVRKINIDIKAKLMLFKLFDKYVVAHLGQVYDICNKLLMDQKVLPSLRQDIKNRRRPKVNARRSSGHKVEQGSTDVGDEVLNTLRDLLAENRGPGGAGVDMGEPVTTASYGSSSTGASSLRDNEILSLLSMLQQKQLSSSAGQFSGGIKSALADLATQQYSGNKIGQVDDDVINLVNMLFEFILDDRNLADPMKALLGRMQIPILKVAVADKSFFGKGSHPARRLLNEMATAALGWQDTGGKGGEGRDPLYRKLDEIVQSVLNDFDTDQSIFNDLLTDFVSFVEKERRRAAILEQRTVDAEDGKARSEAARKAVSRAIKTVIAGRSLPKVVDKLLQEAWGNVMYLVHLRKGSQSESWTKVLVTAEDLVWSVASPNTVENRKRLLSLVQSLLGRLRSGLESISYNPFEMSNLFKELEQLHMQKLKAPLEKAGPEQEEPQGEQATVEKSISEQRREEQRKPVKELAPNEQALESKSAQKVTGPVSRVGSNIVSGTGTGTDKNIGVNTKTDAIKPSAGTQSQAAETSDGQGDIQTSLDTQTVSGGGGPALLAQPRVGEDAEPAVASAPEGKVWDKIDRLTLGTWFEMTDESDKTFRCRLAAIIKPAGKYIFVNRNGMKVTEKNRSSLAQAIELEDMRILDDGMLFDRALESVIGSLRKEQKDT